MSADTATAVLEIPSQTQTTKRTRRGRKSAEAIGSNGTEVQFFLGEQDGSGLLLSEKFESEGHAMIEALKRGVPFYRVEIWKSCAIVKDGAVEVKKEAFADGFRKTSR